MSEKYRVVLTEERYTTTYGPVGLHEAMKSFRSLAPSFHPMRMASLRVMAESEWCRIQARVEQENEALREYQ